MYYKKLEITAEKHSFENTVIKSYEKIRSYINNSQSRIRRPHTHLHPQTNLKCE